MYGAWETAREYTKFQVFNMCIVVGSCVNVFRGHTVTFDNSSESDSLSTRKHIHYFISEWQSAQVTCSL